MQNCFKYSRFRQEDVLNNCSNACLISAIAALFERDEYLFERDVHEVSINHRLANYLEYYLQQQAENPLLFAEIEYNRLYRFDLHDGSGQMSFLQDLPNLLDIMKKGKYVRPDIVIHERGRRNLCWIEVKIGENIGVCEYDKRKCYLACRQFDFEQAVSLLINYRAKSVVVHTFNKYTDDILVDTVSLKGYPEIESSTWGKYCAGLYI